MAQAAAALPRAFVLGAAALPLNPVPALSPLHLMAQAVQLALSDAGLGLGDVTGLVASPSLAPGLSFMPAHQLATFLGMLPGRGDRAVSAASINTCGASPVSAAKAGGSTSSTAGGLAVRPVCVTSIDAGGASPVAGLALARRMIQCEGHSVVVVAAADAVASLPRSAFLALADAACQGPDPAAALPSPVIPHAYDSVARWQMAHTDTSSSGDHQGAAARPGEEDTQGSAGAARQGRLTRQQLAMCASLMTLQASRHPNALSKRALTVQEVLASPQVAPCTTVAECAKRADGGGALVLVSESVWNQLSSQPRPSGAAVSPPPSQTHACSCHASTAPASSPPSPTGSHLVAVEVVGTGEASGPSFPPPMARMDGHTFASCRQAVELAAREAGIGMEQLAVQVDYFGLYDCFPICLVRAIEAVGLAAPGQGGSYVERAYQQLLPSFHMDRTAESVNVRQATGGCPECRKCGSVKCGCDSGAAGPCLLPVNTHGGLLGQGAPWEAPAMYSLVEAVEQLRWQAVGRQVPSARTALVYGNGGIFSASAVAILKRVEAAAQPSGGPLDISPALALPVSKL